MISSKGRKKPESFLDSTEVERAKICDGRREIKLNLLPTTAGEELREECTYPHRHVKATDIDRVGPTDPEGTRLDLWISEIPKISAWELCPVLARGSEPTPSTTAQRAHNVHP
eukprot:scaffold1685_cov105-Skeletonema_dohrnii-CCMP3373.AAC.3